MKSNISPMWLTYHMVDWDGMGQSDSNQRCTYCGRPMKKTETVTDPKGVGFEGYVCHSDKHVTWVRVS